MHTTISKVIVLSLALTIPGITMTAPAAQFSLIQRTANTPRQKKTPTPASNLSPKAIRSELKTRKLNPSAANTPAVLRDAFTAYEFHASGSGLNSNNKEFWEAAKNLSISLSQTSLQSNVTIRTKNPGARVWYRLIGRDATTPFNQLTNNTQDNIPIGLYYIWAERDGKTTSSDKIVFRVIQEKVSIDLAEVAQ